MFIRQLSVFLVNKRGRVDEVLKILADHNIDIVSVSLADTNEFGVFRMLVNDPDKAHQVLKEKNITSKINDVLGVNVANETGSLQKVVVALHDADIDIRYIYGLSLNQDGASIVIKTDDLDKTKEVLERHQVQLISQADLV